MTPVSYPLPAEARPLLALLDKPQPPVLIVVGTGISLGATGENRSTWQGLLNNGVDFVETHGPWKKARADAERVIINESFSAEFNLTEVLQRADSVTNAMGGVTGAGFSEWLKVSVGSLKARSDSSGTLHAIRDLVRTGALVMTTNYDDVLCEALDLPPVTWEEPERILEVINRKRTGIIHIHGHWKRPTSVIFGTKSYDKITQAEVLQKVFTSLWLQWHWMYLGVGAGVEDPNLGQMLEWGSRHFGQSGLPDYFVGRADVVDVIRSRKDRLENVIPITYREHADLPDLLRCLAPQARCAPFHRVVETSTLFRQAREGRTSNLFPSWQEFINGDVPAFEADDVIKARFETHGWAMVVDVASVGKTTLSLRFATSPELAFDAVYYLELRQTIDNESAFETEAFSSLRRLARPGTLFIFDDAHHNPRLTRALWEAWREKSNGSRLIVLATRMEIGINLGGENALLSIENALGNPAITLRPTKGDLLRVFACVTRRLSKGNKADLSPPDTVIGEWHRVYGSEVGAFIAAIIQRRRQLLDGDWELPASAASEWVQRRHLEKLSAAALENAACMSAFSDQTLELAVDEQALPYPKDIRQLRSSGLVQVAGTAQSGAIQYRLREPGLGRLILAALDPRRDIMELLTAAAMRSPSLSVSLTSRLRRARRHTDKDLLWRRIDSDPVILAVSASLSPLWLVARLLEAARREGASNLITCICHELARNSHQLREEVRRITLADSVEFAALLVNLEQPLAKEIWSSLVEDEERSIGRLADCRLRCLIQLLNHAPRPSRLVDSAWQALCAPTKALALELSTAPAGDVTRLLTVAIGQERAGSLATLWSAVFSQESELNCHALEPATKQHAFELIAAAACSTTFGRAGSIPLTDLLHPLAASHPQILGALQAGDQAGLVRYLAAERFLSASVSGPPEFSDGIIGAYFLAAHLARAVRHDDFSAWQIRRPRPDTLVFLGQILKADGNLKAQSFLARLLSEYHRGASEVAFAYTLVAIEKGYPSLPLTGFQLDDADLQDLRIGGNQEAPLALQDCSFRHANLSGVVLMGVDVRRVDFSGADLFNAEFTGGTAVGVNFKNADLSGAAFRGMVLAESNFGNAQLHRTRFLHCDLDTAAATLPRPPAVFCAQVRIKDDGHRSNSPPPDWVATAMYGHLARINGMAFSPDSFLLVSASDDNTLRVWDRRSCEPIRVLTGHNGAVRACEFSPCGRYIVSASDDKTLRVWDIVGSDAPRILTGHDGPVIACAFSKDGLSIVSGSEDRTVCLWNPLTGERSPPFRGHAGPVSDCAFSPDRALIASASEDGSVRLWREDGFCIGEFSEHNAAVVRCAFLPDGRHIASATADGTIRISSVSAHRHERILQLGGTAVRAFAISPDESSLLAIYQDGTIHLWDLNTGLSTSPLSHASVRTRVSAVSRDCQFVASSDGNGVVTTQSIHTGRSRKLRQAPIVPIRACTGSPAGDVIYSGSHDGALRSWSTSTGECMSSNFEHQEPIQCVSVSADGALIVTGAYDRTIRLWDRVTGTKIKAFRGHEHGVRACAFSPDGSRIVSASYDRTVRVWDIRTGSAALVLRGHIDRVLGCAFSPDGRSIASVSNDRTVKIWNSQSGELISELRAHTGPVQSCSFSQDGTWLATASYDRTLRIWDLERGVVIRTMTDHSDRLLCCAFSSDGRLVASAAYDHTIRIWDWEKSICRSVLRGHQAGVRTCFFSDSDATLVSSGEDGTIRMWDVASGEPKGFLFHVFGSQDIASLSANASKVIQLGGEARRWIRWTTNRAAAPIYAYPVESQGSPLSIGQNLSDS